MTRGTLTTVVASVVIFGHLIVFIVALALGVFSLLRGVDAIQTLLMASPILATIALAAFAQVMSGNPAPQTTNAPKLSRLFCSVSIIFPLVLIIVILSLFGIFYLQVDGFGPDQLKIALGSTETFFGVFLGAISKALFGAFSSGARPVG